MSNSCSSYLGFFDEFHLRDARAYRTFATTPSNWLDRLHAGTARQLVLPDSTGFYGTQLETWNRNVNGLVVLQTPAPDAFARSVARVRGDGTLEAWVWRIVVNAARDARRRLPAPAEPAETRTNGHAPVVPLDLLTERQREIVFLHYYADLDYVAIAEALAISPGTVGATLNAARATLRQALEEVRT